MLALATTSSIIQVTCDTAADLDCHASSVDMTVATGVLSGVISTSTEITVAGSTTIVPAPAAGDRRNVHRVSVANVDASLGGTVAVEHYNGTVAITIWRGYLGPGGVVQMGDDGRFSTVRSAASVAGTRGSAVIDFGTDNQLAQVTVTGQPLVHAGSKVEAYVMPVDGIDHNEDEHLMMQSITVFSVPVSSIVAGVGFTIRAFSDHLLTGRYTINWVGDY